jgi:hypothetical protein
VDERCCLINNLWIRRMSDGWLVSWHIPLRTHHILWSSIRGLSSELGNFHKTGELGCTFAVRQVKWMFGFLDFTRSVSEPERRTGFVRTCTVVPWQFLYSSCIPTLYLCFRKPVRRPLYHYKHQDRQQNRQDSKTTWMENTPIATIP